MDFLNKLGQTPTKSFRYFLIGLLLFTLGVGLIYLVPEISENLQIFSLSLIGLGCLFAIWGYIGIFSSRLLIIMNSHPATKKEQNKR
ncbi:MAG: hypothetical protein ACSHW0_04560 [Thalassotalea sp.]